MASRPRTAERPHANRGRRGRGSARERAREGIPRSVDRVQEILSTCPESMGSGLFVDDTESGRVHRGQAVAKIKGLLGQIKANVQDPDLSLCADLQRVAELRQTVFREPELLEAVSEILVGKGVKTSIQPSGGREEPRHAQAAACAILLATLKALPEWPVAIVEVYMHDALGGRHWASHSACKMFVDNLRTAWAPPPPPPLPAPSAAPPRAPTAGGGDAELSSGKEGESDLKGKSAAEAEEVMVAPSTTAKIIAAGLHPSSGAAVGGGGGGSDVGDDSSSSDGEMIVEEGGHVESVLPATSIGGGRGTAAAVAAAATAAAKALARRREQETNTFSGFEKISLDGEDENIPAVSDRFARNRAAAEKAVISALHERFGRSFGEVLEKQRDRRIMGWAHHEKKTEWQVVLAATELSTLTAVRAFVAPHLNRWLNSPAFKDMAIDLLQVLVQRVDPALEAEGDGVVVDAILSIDTDRPSLKPLYRSAVQELLRRHPKFSSRVLESSLVDMRGVAGKDLKKGGMDPGIASSSSSDGSGGVHHKAAATVVATERTKTVLACLFEALGAKRATQEVAKVLCAFSAGTAEAMTHFSSSATAATVEGQEQGKDDASVAARAVAPQALLPVLTSMPGRSVDVVSIALEMLETGQSAADALARGVVARDGGKVVFSVAADAAGRDLSYLASLSGPSLRRWAAILSASVREMVLWRARGDCATAREADSRRKVAVQAEANMVISTQAIRKRATEAGDGKPSALSTAATLLRKQRLVAANPRGTGSGKGPGQGSATGGPSPSSSSRGFGVAGGPGVTMRSVRVKFAKDMAPIHRAGLLWCERAAPSLLLAGEPDRDYSASGDGRRGGLWRDCLAIVRNLTLLNGNHGVGSGASIGGMTRSVPADCQGDESTEARDLGLICDRTAVLEGEGVRSALRLAAHPVNAPAAELLELLEALVLRAARSRLMFKTSSSISSAAPATPHGSGSSAASGGGPVATPLKRPRLATVISPSSASPPPGRSAHPASVGGGGGRARSGSISGVGGPGAQAGGGSGVVPRHVGAASTALGAGGVGPMSAVMLTVTNVDVEKGILAELFNLSSHKVPRKSSSSTSVMAMHNFVNDVTTKTGTGAAGQAAGVSKKSSGFWGDVLSKEQQPRGGKDQSRPGEGRAGSPRDSGGGSPRGEGAEKIPRLARSELFWRAAVVALVLGATNPGSVGRQLWEASPTMRCLMQMLVCTDFRFPPPGGAVSLHGEGNIGNSNGGDGGGRRARLGSEDASGPCPGPSSITGPRRPGATEGVSTEEAPSKSLPKSSSSSRRRRASEDDGFSPLSFFPIQGAGSGVRRSRRGSGTVDDDDETDNRDGPGGAAAVDGGRGPGSGSGGAGLEGGEEMMVAADERVRREERAAVDRYYAKRARRHRKPPPPPRPPKRKRAPEPVQVSKRGRRLVKTIKPVEQPESSEEEELTLSAQDQEESDPEDFPPGAPEIRYADFIKLDIGMPARRPPDSVLRTVEELDRELGLGAELRRCTRPDFITQVVAGGDPEHVGRKSVERSAKWLVSAVASEPEALLRRLPLAVTVHLLLLACHQAYEEDHARRAKEVVSASSAATTAASSSSSAAVAAVPASTATPTSSRPAATAPSTAKQPPPPQPLSTTPARHGHHRRGSESALLGPRGPGSSLADVLTAVTTTSTGTTAETVAATVESSGARGMGWAGLFDGPPPSRVAMAGGGRGTNASVPTHHKRETPRLRWLARALRDSVAERVWAAPLDGSGGEGAVEAMKLLLDDLAHSYQGRRESARRALQSVLASPPEGRRGSSGGIARERRVAWTPEKRRQPSLERAPETEEGEERVVVLQQEADEEQCGWLFWCRDIPAWENVAPLVVRSVRESIFYETSADPIRFSLLGLDLITRQPLRQTTPSSSASDEAPATETSAGREKEVEEGGKRQQAATMARRQDRWFFTLLLCKLLSGRRMVASNTLQRYPETFDLAASAVNAALRGATVDGVDLFAEGSVWPPRPKTRFPSLDPSTRRVKTVLLPPLLLETAIALLSFHRADAGLTQELKELQELVFPTEQPTAPPEASRETGARGARGSGGGSGVVGAGAAKMEASAKDAVGVKLWVRLAQAPSRQMSALAARHIPKMLLPRLLLASGLSRSCVRVTLSRLDSLGRAADNADELYQYLISPDAQGTWDMGNTMQSTKSLRDKLSRRVRAYLCTDDGDTKDDKDRKVKAKPPSARGLSGADKKGNSEEGMFVAWLVEPPRQSGAGERGSGRAAAQAAAQEQQQRKVAQMFLLADAPATSTTTVSSSSKKKTTKLDSGSNGNDSKGKGRGRSSDDDIPGTTSISGSSGGGEAASPGRPSPSKGRRSSRRSSAAAANRKGDDEEKDVRVGMSGGGPVGGVDGDHTLGIERETGGGTAEGGGSTSEKENTVRVSVYRCLSREEQSLKQFEDEDEVDASATAVTNMARAKAGGDLQRGEGGEKERLGGGKGLLEEWLRAHLTEALCRADDGVKDVLVTLRALESWRTRGLSVLCEGGNALLLSIASPPRPRKTGAAPLNAKATSHGTVRPLENGSAGGGGTSGGVSLARRYEEALRATERVEEVFRRAKVVALQVLVTSCSTPLSLQQQQQQLQHPKAEGGGEEGSSGASGGKGRGKNKKNPNTNNTTNASEKNRGKGKGDTDRDGGGSAQGDGDLESGVDKGELVLATSGGGGGWQAGFALRRAQQAIVDFVLSDPEDETVWEGILHGIPFSPAKPPSDHHHHRHQRLYTCTLYWRSVLLEGALRACTPDAAEKRLRSALRTAASRGDHAGGRSGTEAEMEEAGAVAGTPVEKAQGETKSETAVLMLTGLCRLARDWRVFASGPVVGGVGGADSLEAWARPYFHQRDAEGSPRAALDAAGWGSGGDSSPGSLRSWMAFSPAEVKELVKLIILGAGMKAKTKAEAESVSETESRVPVESADDAGSERRGSRRLQSKRHDTASEALGEDSPDAAASAFGASDAATVNAACNRSSGGNDSSAAVPVAWAWLLLTACSGKRDNLAAAVEDLVAARGGPDLVEDEEDSEDEDHDDEGNKSEGEEAEEGEAGDVDVSEAVKVDVDVDIDMEDQGEEDEIASSKPSDDADADAEDDADDNAEEVMGDDADDNAEEVMEEEEEGGDDVEEEKGDDEDQEMDDDEENDKEQVEEERAVEDEEPKVEGGGNSDNDDNNKSDNGEGKHANAGKFSERDGRRAARAAAGYLLYQLYMTAPVDFENCVGPEMHSRLLPVLADQFVVCAPPVPYEAGPRGPGLGVAVAAHALAGVGLIAGEKGTGRKRAAASAAVHSAVLADVARRMPLVFLEQLLVLTEVLLNDAEVERSAAAATISTRTDEPATVVEEDHSNHSLYRDRDGVAGGRPSGAGTTVFRSRRIAPARLCPVPALLRGMVVDTDGRTVGDKGDKILVHVRIWGQYFTEVAWRGVLRGLRAAPASTVGGAAGRAASVQRLLEAFLNLVAVQLMMDNGPEVAPLAVELLALLETLGEMGASLLSAAPPAGGGPWSTARDMLVSIPTVIIADPLMRNWMK